ncbi:hypothetical protein BKA62DRAFT_165746 [Auriculariales sp. MPI-PUGE-AT-0066]|nr:hypothetical protein BKA62DRAFT_165746 [Auriculariales sp. MPI-PUGE-AT-0066]
MYAAQCTGSIEEIQLNRKNLSAAESELQFAISEFQVLGDSFGAAQCTEHLNDVRIRQGDYDLADKLLVSAQELFMRVDLPSSVAHCHWSFGTLYRGQRSILEAIGSFETARNIFGVVGFQDWVANCNSKMRCNHTVNVCVRLSGHGLEDSTSAKTT